MAKSRRRGAETSETRTLLLDVTEQVMLEEGYAAVSSRRIARGAEVTPALVHYYFGTLDELFLAVLRRRADQQLERQERLLESSPRPLHALWQMISDPARTGLVIEFMSLANHRKSIRGELADHAERFRRSQLELLGQRLDDGDLPQGVDPMSLLVLVNAAATTLVLERSIGVDLGHRDAVALVERELDRLDDAHRVGAMAVDTA